MMSSDFKKKSKNKNKLSIKIQKKKVFRTTEPLIAIFMWGVNYTHNEVKNIPMPELLMPDEFKAYIKVKIDNQNFNKAILPSHYKVKEYCPIVFKNIRERFSINEDSYLKSLTHGEMEPLDETSGKSNAKFYVSYDKRYIIKTITSEDVEGLHNMLSEYHKHIVETRGDTLLPHLLSLFRLTVENKENYILVMRNVFVNKYRIHTKYDIKGSSVDRAASTKEKEKNLPTYKDNDLLSVGRLINIGTEAKKVFMDKLTRDVEFLCTLNIMDYSLLIGIHENKTAATQSSQQQQSSSSSNDEQQEQPILSSSPKNNENNDLLTGANNNNNLNDYYSDQDNFSPGEDAEDTDDGQLNLSGLTPPESPTSSKYQYGIFGIPSAPPKNEIYFMALVDILTHFGLKKKSANIAKNLKYGDQEISTVKPDQYSKRFLDFVNKIIV